VANKLELELELEQM